MMDTCYILHLSKPNKSDCNGNYQLWVIMTYQYSLISGENCAARMVDVDQEGEYACMGQGVYWKSSYLWLNFAMNLKL